MKENERSPTLYVAIPCEPETQSLVVWLKRFTRHYQFHMVI